MRSLTKFIEASFVAIAIFSFSFAQAQTTHVVTVSNFEFTPANLTIAPGDIVTFENVEGFHNASGSTGIFPENPESFTTGAPELAPWSQSVTFTLEGTYTYQCDIHTNMVGTITVSSPEPPCEAPYPAAENLNAAIQANGVLISWDPILGSIGCQIRVAPQGGAPTAKTIAGTEVSQFFIPGQFLSFGTTYDWGVRCGCSQNPLIVGPWVNSTFSTPVSLAISSSPNPVVDVSNVTFTAVDHGLSSLEVYDMSGRVVETIFNGMASADTDYRFAFDASNLPNGIYLYRLTTPSEIVTEKFLIAR